MGCPRSGTTLLQALLAGHPDIYSLPETHFFECVRPMRWWGWAARWLGAASRRGRARLAGQLRELGRADLQTLLPQSGWLSRLSDRLAPGDPALPACLCGCRSLVRAFVAALDRIALDAQATVWIEKTPAHVFYIRDIARYVPEARFVHLVRRGEDVVASLYDLAMRYPDERWTQPFRHIEACIAEWNRSVTATKRWLGQPGHMVVRYEQLIEQPDQTVAGITDLLGLRRMDEVDISAEKAEALIRPDEPWKAAVTSGVRKPEDKFARLFDEPQQQFIHERLVDVSDLWET